MWGRVGHAVLRVWQAHDEAVRSMLCMSCEHGPLITASSDHTVRVWPLSSLLEPEADLDPEVYEGHTDAVIALGIEDGRVYSCAFDSVIRSWALRTAPAGMATGQ